MTPLLHVHSLTSLLQLLCQLDQMLAGGPSGSARCMSTNSTLINGHKVTSSCDHPSTSMRYTLQQLPCIYRLSVQQLLAQLQICHYFLFHDINVDCTNDYTYSPLKLYIYTECNPKERKSLSLSVWHTVTVAISKAGNPRIVKSSPLCTLLRIEKPLALSWGQVY